MTSHRILRKAISHVAWSLPTRDRLARRALRCVLFHHIWPAEDELTAGLRVTLHPEEFADRLRFLGRHYDLLTLSELLSGSPLPDRPLLVTIDDTYRSVVMTAAPVARELKVPLVCFVNSSLIDNARLSFDNLAAYVANTQGIGLIRRAADDASIRDLQDLFERYLPALTMSQRRAFEQRLQESAGSDGAHLASAAQLYLSTAELRSLAESGVEIGNHTATHVHCRALDQSGIMAEVIEAGRLLETYTGKPVRSLSLPYGARRDATPLLLSVLRDEGYQAVFLVEAGVNRAIPDLWAIERVAMRAGPDRETWFDLEIKPRWEEWRRPA